MDLSHRSTSCRVFLSSKRKPENPEKNHTDSGRTCETPIREEPEPRIEETMFFYYNYVTLYKISIKLENSRTDCVIMCVLLFFFFFK